MSSANNIQEYVAREVIKHLESLDEAKMRVLRLTMMYDELKEKLHEAEGGNDFYLKAIDNSGDQCFYHRSCGIQCDIYKFLYESKASYLILKIRCGYCDKTEKKTIYL